MFLPGAISCRICSDERVPKSLSARSTCAFHTFSPRAVLEPSFPMVPSPLNDCHLFQKALRTHSWRFDSSRRSQRSFLSAGAPVTTHRILFKTSPHYPVHWPGPLRQYSELL